MKLQKLIALFIISISTALHASDDKWAYVGGGSNSQVFLQNSEVVSDVSSGNVEAWTKAVFLDGSHILDKHRYACSKDEHLKLESYKYDINNNYQSGGTIEPVWFSVIPESVGELIMKTVCTTAARQEIDKIQLMDGSYTSDDAFALIRNSFGSYADAVIMINIQESIDNIEW